MRLSPKYIAESLERRRRSEEIDTPPCICPNCGHEFSVDLESPDLICPRCGTDCEIHLSPDEIRSAHQAISRRQTREQQSAVRARRTLEDESYGHPVGTHVRVKSDLPKVNGRSHPYMGRTGVVDDVYRSSQDVPLYRVVFDDGDPEEHSFFLHKHLSQETDSRTQSTRISEKVFPTKGASVKSLTTDYPHIVNPILRIVPVQHHPDTLQHLANYMSGGDYSPLSDHLALVLDDEDYVRATSHLHGDSFESRSVAERNKDDLYSDVSKSDYRNHLSGLYDIRNDLNTSLNGTEGSEHHQDMKNLAADLDAILKSHSAKAWGHRKSEDKELWYPGDEAEINAPGHPMHGARVTINQIDGDNYHITPHSDTWGSRVVAGYALRRPSKAEGRSADRSRKRHEDTRYPNEREVTDYSTAAVRPGDQVRHVASGRVYNVNKVTYGSSASSGGHVYHISPESADAAGAPIERIDGHYFHGRWEKI